MSCPMCNSGLYERTPVGWCCSKCNYREPLGDLDVLTTSSRPGQIRGNVWGEKRNPAWNRDDYLTERRKPRKGSLSESKELYARNKQAALSYLTERSFSGKNDYNRHYLAAKMCLELGQLNQAKKHIDVCMSNLAHARSRQAITVLDNQIEEARREVLHDPLRRRKLR